MQIKGSIYTIFDTNQFSFMLFCKKWGVTKVLLQKRLVVVILVLFRLFKTYFRYLLCW
jgi:hypothetical protein